MIIEEAIEKIVRDAFNAAKERYPDQTGDIKLYDGDTLPYHPERFKTFEDYQKHLKYNSHEKES